MMWLSDIDTSYDVHSEDTKFPSFRFTYKWLSSKETLNMTMSHRPRHQNEHRSRSPRSSTNQQVRLRSPTRPSHGHHHASSHKHRSFESSPSVTLPLNAATISKHDFETYRPMFGLYLDIQKQLLLEELAPDEVRGRWKSFVGKW